jgi:fatty-acyl-CoA synthase
MAAILLRDNDSFDPVAFDDFLGSQTDLGTKCAPRFVRLTSQFPLTQTNKIQKRQLRSELWITSDRIWWKPDKADPYRLFTSEDADQLSEEFERNGRGTVLSTFSRVPSRRPATTDSGEVTTN